MSSHHSAHPQLVFLLIVNEICRRATPSCPAQRSLPGTSPVGRRRDTCVSCPVKETRPSINFKHFKVQRGFRRAIRGAQISNYTFLHESRSVKQVSRIRSTTLTVLQLNKYTKIKYHREPFLNTASF